MLQSVYFCQEQSDMFSATSDLLLSVLTLKWDTVALLRMESNGSSSHLYVLQANSGDFS